MTEDFDIEQTSQAAESAGVSAESLPVDSEHRPPLEIARSAFELLVAGPQPLAVDGRDVPGLPDRPIPVDELRRLLLAGDCPAQARTAVWAHLVRRSRTHGPAWTMACVGMALPGLVRIARLLEHRFRGERADLQSAMLTGFVEELRRLDPDQPDWLSARLVWAVYRAGLAAVTDSLRAAIPAAPEDLPTGEKEAATPTAPGFRSTVPQRLSGHPDLVLARAVADGALTATEAELIGTTRLDDLPLTVWARRRGMGYSTANSLRWRAEQRLIDYLSHDRLDRAAHEDTVTPDALTRTTLTAGGTPGRPDAATTGSPSQPAHTDPTPPGARSQKKTIRARRARKSRKNRSSPL